MALPKIITAIDGYKADHRRQYPEGTTLVYSNFTPRSSRIPGVDRFVLFGLQAFIKKYLIDEFNVFFDTPKDQVVAEYRALMESYSPSRI